MLVHLRLRRLTQDKALSSHREKHMLADQSLEILVLEDVANKRIRHTILNRPQIHMRQRCLRNRADSPRHTRQIIRQRLVNGYVGGTGSVAVVHEPQQAVAFSLVECDIVHIGHQVFKKQDVDSRSIILGPLRLILGNHRRDAPDLVVGQIIVLSHHWHCRSQNRVDALYMLERERRACPEVVAVDTESSVGSNHVGIPSYCALVTVFVGNIHFLDESVVPVMSGSIQEVHRRVIGIEVSDPELNDINVFTFKPDKRVGGPQRFKVLMGCNGDRPVTGIHLRCPIGRIVSAQIIKFGDVINAITINIGRLRHLVLLNPILVRGQRRQIVRERGEAGLPPCYRHRNLIGSRLAPPRQRHIKNEVVVGCGSDDYGNGSDGDRCGGRRNITLLTRARY